MDLDLVPVPEWVMIQPLFPVQAGDTLQVRGWFLAPENNGGGISLGVDYLNGVYSAYDRTRLQADIQPYRDLGGREPSGPFWWGSLA